MPYKTTEAAATLAGAAAIAGPVGVAVGSVATAAASVYDTFSSFLTMGLSPRPEWDEANKIAEPTARRIVEAIVDKLGAEAPGKILPSYAERLKQYILTSPHSDAKTRTSYAYAVQTEAVEMQGGFRLDAFAFDRPETVQLAWAIWLHALWLYGNVSKDEVANKNALRKFNESLGPTLAQAIVETTGTQVDTETATNVFGPGTVPNSKPEAKAAATGSNTLTIILLVGVALGLIYFSARGS